MFLCLLLLLCPLSFFDLLALVLYKFHSIWTFLVLHLLTGVFFSHRYLPLLTVPFRSPLVLTSLFQLFLSLCSTLNSCCSSVCMFAVLFFSWV